MLVARDRPAVGEDVAGKPLGFLLLARPLRAARLWRLSRCRGARLRGRAVGGLGHGGAAFGLRVSSRPAITHRGRPARTACRVLIAEGTQPVATARGKAVRPRSPIAQARTLRASRLAGLPVPRWQPRSRRGRRGLQLRRSCRFASGARCLGGDVDSDGQFVFMRPGQVRAGKVTGAGRSSGWPFHQACRRIRSSVIAATACSSWPRQPAVGARRVPVTAMAWRTVPSAPARSVYCSGRWWWPARPGRRRGPGGLCGEHGELSSRVFSRWCTGP